MSLEQFLKEAESIASGGGSSNQFAIIAKAQVSFAYRGGFAKTSKFFPYKLSNAQDKANARVECQAYMKEVGEDKWNDGGDKWPVIGILTQIHGDDVPTQEGGKRWQTMPNHIWPEFIEEYHNDRSFAALALSDEDRASVNGAMPYTVIINALKESNPPAALFQKPVWCKLTQEIQWWDQLQVKLGKRNPNTYPDKTTGEEKEAPYRFWVVQHVYANEKEAKADAEKIKAEQPAQVMANGELSAKALETWGDLASKSEKEAKDEALTSLQGQKENIEKAIQEAEKKGLAPSAAQATTAKEYGIEEADLSVIGIEVSPF